MSEDEEETKTAEVADDSVQEAVAEGKPEKVEAVEEAAVEGEEAKVEEVAVPELTDEQVAALRERDERFKPPEAPADLSTLVRDLFQEQEKTKETEQTQAAERKSLEDAVKAAREDNDPAPLAQIALEQYDRHLENVAVAAKLDEAVNGRLGAFMEAEYGEQIRALKPEEVKRLDEMPVTEEGFPLAALQELNRLRVEAARGESAETVDAANQAAQNAGTAAAARSESGGLLPGGSAEETVSEDIGTLMRQGMETALDVEEAVGG